MEARRLIVNADDFGRSHGINHGIRRAHERGIVTSASLMVRWPAAVEAAGYGRTHRQLSLGLHVDLGEWVCRNDTWEPLYEVASPKDAAAVADEVRRQLSAFRRLVGANPTHLDSHQHVHREEPLRTVLRELGHELAVPVRHYSQDVRYCPAFYGQTAEGALLHEAITVAALTRILAALPPGITELGCHPGDEAEAESTYCTERVLEADVLCDPLVRAALAEMRIALCSFKDVVT